MIRRGDGADRVGGGGTGEVGPADQHRSGFVALVGRPNVGKSTLMNQLVGTKVSIVSDRPQTTRNQVRGVVDLPGAQIVLLDTPGIHRPRTLSGERANERARSTLSEVDAVCLLVDAQGRIGPGDRHIAELVRAADTPAVLVVNKVDAATRDQVVERLATAAAQLGEFDEFVPLSARTGEGCDVLVRALERHLSPGPRFYPAGTVTDQPESFVAAELLREKLLARAREELPHSIAVVVDEIEERETERGPLVTVRAVVLVERPSQKGMVIGKGGAVLRDAGTEARLELEALLGAQVHLETRVRVERDWQRRAHALDRLGL